jgi:hypothetical protein
VLRPPHVLILFTQPARMAPVPTLLSELSFWSQLETTLAFKAVVISLYLCSNISLNMLNKWVDVVRASWLPQTSRNCLGINQKNTPSCHTQGECDSQRACMRHLDDHSSCCLGESCPPGSAGSEPPRGNCPSSAPGKPQRARHLCLPQLPQQQQQQQQQQQRTHRHSGRCRSTASTSPSP